MGNLVRFETHAGESIQIRDARLIPFTQVLYVQIPGVLGGILWERPVSILVERDDGEEQIIPIQNVTRAILFGLFGVLALTWLVTRNIRK